jgi:cation diffusion facilitator CzcD-associated flavoprotein CzcO
VADVVVVVGAGASGLAVAAALKGRGVDPVVLERDAKVGTTWARRYDRLHLHTVRRFSGLPQHGLPRTLPRYVSKDAYAAYLSDYASRVGLDVRTGTPVHRVRAEGGGWLVDAVGEHMRARAVVVATGRHNVPQLPAWPGSAEFGGRLLHSVDYRSGREFTGEQVLVVGLGNSGAEIAADLVEQGATASVAVRSTPPITSREIAGVPVQIFGLVLHAFPARLVDRVGKAMRRVGTGDLRPYGLGPEDWGPFGARRPPVIDVGFVKQLKAGRVRVLPELVALTPTGAVFADGSEQPFDVVVAATGFTTGLEQLVEAPGALDERGYPLPGTSPPGLYFSGYEETPRGQLFEANRSSRRLAAAVVDHLERTS